MDVTVYTHANPRFGVAGREKSGRNQARQWRCPLEDDLFGMNQWVTRVLRGCFMNRKKCFFNMVCICLYVCIMVILYFHLFFILMEEHFHYPRTNSCDKLPLRFHVVNDRKTVRRMTFSG